MKDYQKIEFERIKQLTNIDEKQKAYLIRLVSMTQDERNAYERKRNELKRSLTYNITLSGDELVSIQFAVRPV